MMTSDKKQEQINKRIFRLLIKSNGLTGDGETNVIERYKDVVHALNHLTMFSVNLHKFLVLAAMQIGEEKEDLMRAKHAHNVLMTQYQEEFEEILGDYIENSIPFPKEESQDS